MVRKHLDCVTLVVMALLTLSVLPLWGQDSVDIQNQIQKEIGKEEVSRQGDFIVATEFMRTGNKAYEQGEYSKAVDAYLKAKESLAACSASSEFVQERAEVCNRMIAKCYFNWSQDVARQAERAVAAKEYDKAIGFCREAAQIDPSCAEKMAELIEKYSKMKKVVAYRKRTSEETVDPKKESRLYDIDVLLKQGDVLHKDGQFDQARDKYEEVLSINPYNMEAIEKIRQCNASTLQTGRYRTHATRTERIAEVEWKMVSPLIPRTMTGESETVETPVVREDVNSKIQRKLREIIIDHIEFEEVTIPTVVKYLKQRSRQIDQEGAGVNIFLRLQSPGSTTTEKQPAPDGEVAAKKGDDDDAGWGDDDDDDGWGDDDDDGAKPAAGAGGGATEIPTVTMVVDDIPLGEAIRYICRAANLKYRIEKYAVVIASQNVPFEEVETRIYPLESEAVDTFGGGDDPEQIREHFARRGISFPDGAKIVYDSRISRLIATNTPDNLSRIEEIIKELNVVDPQVLVQAKFVEVIQNDLDELGFEWHVGRNDPAAGETFAVNERSWTSVAAGDTLPYDAYIFDGSGQYIGRTNAGNAIAAGAYAKKATISRSSATFNRTAAGVLNFDNPVRNVEDAGLGDVTAGSRPDELVNFNYYNLNGVRLNAVLHALDQMDSADVLSTPRVTTMNGQEATIRMVTERYYPEEWTEPNISTIGTVTNTATGVTTSAGTLYVSSAPQFGDPTEEGIVLRVTPNVDADHYTITLEMNPVVQERVGWTNYSYNVQIGLTTHTNPVIMPIIEARTVETSVTIYDGETIVLGGIIRDFTDNYDDKIPVLGEIPLIGRLFQSKATRSRKTNLLIFLTCRLVNPDGSPIRERELRGLPAFRQ